MVPLRISEIPYLDADILEEYANVSLISKEGKSVKMNPLIFTAMCTLGKVYSIFQSTAEIFLFKKLCFIFTKKRFQISKISY